MLRSITITLLVLSSFTSNIPCQQVITGQGHRSRSGGGSDTPCVSLPYSDTFTGTGALTSPYTTSTGSTWARASGFLTPGTFDTNAAAWVSGCSGFTTSQYIKAIVSSGADTFGLIVFATNQSNYYYINCTYSGGCNYFKRVSGTSTFLQAEGLTVASGNTVCLEIDSGSKLRLKINSTYDLDSGTLTDLSSGVPGFWANSSSTPVTYSSMSAGNGVCP